MTTDEPITSTIRLPEEKKYPAPSLINRAAIAANPASAQSLFVGILGLALAAFFGVLLGKMIYEPRPAKNDIQAVVPPRTTPTPIPFLSTPPGPQKTVLSGLISADCPREKWIDCRTPARRTTNECTPEYLSWVEGNCTGVAGAAY